MAVERGPRAPVPAAVVVAAGFGALLALDWALSAGDGRSGLVAPTVAAAAVVAVVAFLAPAAAPAIAGIGWTTPAGFAAPPYPDLKPGGTLPAAAALFAVAAVAALLGRAVRRAGTARARTAEARALLDLARTVLADGDDPAAVLAHLRDRWGANGELLELRNSRWMRVAGAPADGTPTLLRPADPPFALRVAGGDRIPSAVLEGYAYQASAALQRRRRNDAAAAAETLAAAAGAREALLAAVGHTLRTQLTPIKAAVSSLRQHDVAWSPADQEELLATIEECADRLAAQIANLLDMSRLSAGTLTPLLRPAAVPELAAAVPRPEIELDLPEDIPLVLTDPTLLARALRNLVEDAVGHAGPDQRPRLTATRAGDRVVLRIVDHAAGHRSALSFEPFDGIDDRHAGAGLGLGLAVARGLVEACGGHLEAMATPGGGRTMYLDLPCAPPEPEQAPTPEVLR
ncbi:MAG TPA: ATP-binding protein [Sporichthyaceae bacterium]|nr:ATP-binding protein [Sporichthyaceae bacterium]